MSAKPKPKPHDPANHPAHYTVSAVEPITAIEAWDSGSNAGDAVKYIARHMHKGNPLEDLKKSRWHIDRAIRRLEEGKTQA